MADDLELAGIPFAIADFEDGKYLDFITVDGAQYPRHLGVLKAFTIDASSRQTALLTGLVQTSTSSVTVGSGSKVFDVGEAASFPVGAYVTAYRTSDAAVFVGGQVASYTDGDLTLTVAADGYEGAGTYTDWTLVLGGRRGATGATGADGDLTEEAADLLYTRQDREGAADGVATLDSGGKVPTSQLTVAATEYKGTWDADANSPDLSALSPSTGDIYRVSTAGTTSLSGIDDWAVGELAVYNGASWDKWGGTGLNALQEDTAPALGGNLDGQGYQASGVRAGSAAEITASTYTTVAADIGRWRNITHGSGCTVTLYASPGEGAQIGFIQRGAGAITFAVASGTLRVRASKNKSAGQYALCLAVYLDGEWHLSGDITT